MSVYSLDYDAIKSDLLNKGFDVQSVRVANSRTTIFFKCSKCGKHHQLIYSNFLKGQNPELLCKDCQVLSGPKMKRINDYFDKLNVPITRIDSSTKHWKIYFPCAKCGVEVKILDDYVGKNNKELCCKNCRSNNTVPTQASLEEYFRSRGSELLSNYVAYHEKLKFKCTQCGAEVESDLAHIKWGYNHSLKCKACLGRDLKPEFDALMKEKGVDVLEEFRSVEEPILVRCTKCSKPFKFRYNNYRYLDHNKYIICSDCYRGITGRDPSKVDEKTGRYDLDALWSKYVKEFFNVPVREYESHHIVRYKSDVDLQTSILNGFPLKPEIHRFGENYSFYHYGPGTDLKNWTGVERLPYHTYSDFEFLDLNSKFVMELLYPTTPMGMNDLHKKKMEYAHMGIQYIPFFITDMYTREKRELVYSMLRARLHKDFPMIYEYTGSHLNKYYARKLKLVKPTGIEAELFFNANHIQGFAQSSVYIGLADETGELITCMSFNKPRFKAKESYDFDMTRYATKINTVVVGGASKMFKAFIAEYKPESVVSFCDTRFSSLDPHDVVYEKLGFDYCGFSDPNYGYREPETGRVLSRRACQKAKISKFLEVYDSNLSESQNMEMNGYVRQVDCGSFKFVWGKHLWY